MGMPRSFEQLPFFPVCFSSKLPEAIGGALLVGRGGGIKQSWNDSSEGWESRNRFTRIVHGDS